MSATTPGGPGDGRGGSPAGPVLFVAPVRRDAAPAGGQVRAATLFAEALEGTARGREGRFTVIPTPVEGEDGLPGRLARSLETARAIRAAVRGAAEDGASGAGGRAGGGDGGSPPLVHIWTAPNRSSLWEKIAWGRAARGSGARVLLGFRNALDHWYRRWSAPERTAVRRALGTLDGILCQYQGLKTFMEEEILRGRRGTRVYVVPNGIPREEWERVGAPFPAMEEATPLRILLLGAVVPRKGAHHLLEALAAPESGLSAAAPSWTLDLVGPEKDPTYAGDLRRTVARAGLEERVRFRGPVPPKERWDVLARAHLVAVPSSAEGFSNVILEAMAVGRPVLATGVGGAADAIDDGETGFLVPPGDGDALSRALARALARALEDPTALDAMGRRAREVVLERFEMGRVTDRLLGVYRDVGERRSG